MNISVISYIEKAAWQFRAIILLLSRGTEHFKLESCKLKKNATLCVSIWFSGHQKLFSAQTSGKLAAFSDAAQHMTSRLPNPQIHTKIQTRTH
jgi:hypothetical protein